MAPKDNELRSKGESFSFFVLEDNYPKLLAALHDTKETRAGRVDLCAQNVIPKFLGKLDAWLSKPNANKFICSDDKLTVYDMPVGSLIFDLLLNPEAEHANIW